MLNRAGSPSCATHLDGIKPGGGENAESCGQPKLCRSWTSHVVVFPSALSGSTSWIAECCGHVVRTQTHLHPLLSEHAHHTPLTGGTARPTARHTLQSHP